MVRQRPTAILVIAILHIIGGAIGLFGACYSVAIMAAAASVPATPPQSPSVPPIPKGTTKGQAPNPPAMPSSSEIMKYYEDHVPGYKAFTFVSLGVGLVLDVMLLVGGVGLLNMQPWARVLSLIYAPSSILFHIITFVCQLLFMVPATQDFYDSYAAGLGPLGSIVKAATLIGLFFSFLVVLYPIAVLIIMLRRSTVAAFRGEMPEPVGDEPFDDDPWRRPPPDDAITR